MEKKKPGYVFVEVFILIVLISLAYMRFRSIQNISGGGIIAAFGPAYFGMLIFTFWLLIIGLIIWDLFSDQISEFISSFILQSGGKISKPKYYSKARSLVMQNKLEEAIKVYEKILEEDNGDITAYCELGDIYHENLKDHSAAFNCYEKVEKYAREATDIIFAINRKVDIYLMDKDYRKAVEELEKITKKFPKMKDAERAEQRIKALKQKIFSTN